MAAAGHAFCPPAGSGHAPGMSVATVPESVLVEAVGRTRHRRTVAGALTMLASGAGNQIGAGLGAHAFPAVGPAGVVALRQVVAAAVLLPLGRPRLRSLSRAQWWPILLLALVFATMNLTLYTAI